MQQKTTRFQKSLSLLLCMMLLAAMALFTTACTDNNSNETDNNQQTEQTNNTVTELGEGNTSFLFTVTDGDGNVTEYKIHTDKTIVGEALFELELITGEEGPYGLYIKTVTDITADYDTNGTYWAFYIDGEYAMTGVDTTTITENAVYAFKVEK